MIFTEHVMKKVAVHILFLFVIMTTLLHGAIKVKDISVTQRWPWNGQVDIVYYVESDELNADGTEKDVFVKFSGYDGDLDRAVVMESISGEGVSTAVKAGGPYTAVWDATEAGADFHSSAFTVRARGLTDQISYLVVDLSSGSNAKKYPYKYTLAGPDMSQDTCRTTQMWFKCIPSGTYTMGSPESEAGRDSQDMAQHSVTISEPFYIALFECSQRQWELVMGTRPSSTKSNAHPVTNVAYASVRGDGWPQTAHHVDASSFIGVLQTKTGLAFDLPTEAQWEYAGRIQKDGTHVTTALASGKNLEGTTTCSNLAVIGRYSGNCNDGQGGGTQHAAVGSYQKTGVGLSDVHGNVAEWCLDWKGADVSAVSAATDPVGPATGSQRIVRGGSWQDSASGCRLASRGGVAPNTGNASLGFRLVQRHNHGITYGLTMTLTPDTARWSVGGKTYTSGETAYLDSGDYDVTFNAQDKYATPETQHVSLDSDKAFTVNYVRQYKLTCNLDVAGAKWTVEGASYNSGTTIDLGEGAHEISFSSVSGYSAPPPQQFNLDKDMTIAMSYTVPMYLVVDLSGGRTASTFPYRYTMDAPDVTNDACRTTELWLRVMEPGTFVMGSPDDELGRKSSDFKQHEVTLTQKFYIGVFECTQKQWNLVMGSTPATENLGDTRPVETVTYEDIRGVFEEESGWPQDGHTVQSSSFLGVISRKTGLVLDLPTEAQWEYACRRRLDGTCYETALNSGKNLSAAYDSPEMDEVGRYGYNKTDGKGGYSEHTVVGSYKPNEVGLYDMHGNVQEWCLDWYSYASANLDAATDPVGPENSTFRVFRGGCYNSDGGAYCRCAYRGHDFPTELWDGLGFRLVCLP